MVIVLIIFLSLNLHNLSVLSLTIPKLGFKIVTGITKSEVRIKFLAKSIVRPWGLKFSPRMLRVDATS